MTAVAINVRFNCSNRRSFWRRLLSRLLNWLLLNLRRRRGMHYWRWRANRLNHTHDRILLWWMIHPGMMTTAIILIRWRGYAWRLR